MDDDDDDDALEYGYGPSDDGALEYGDYGPSDDRKGEDMLLDENTDEGIRSRRFVDEKAAAPPIPARSLFIEAEELSREEILRRIDEIFQLDDTNPLFRVPSRHKNNQLFDPRLRRYVLRREEFDRSKDIEERYHTTVRTQKMLELVREIVRTGTLCNKRFIFYMAPLVFRSQAIADDIFNDVCCMLGCTWSSLNVTGSAKGLAVASDLTFSQQDPEQEDVYVLLNFGVGFMGHPVPSYKVSQDTIRSTARFILLVEKDTIFQHLVRGKWHQKYNCIIITGKGQPDLSTRRFLKALKEKLKIPVLGLVDCDPYGIEILSVYEFGSQNLSFDSGSLAVGDIDWIGIKPSDIRTFGIPAAATMPLRERDLKKLINLRRAEWLALKPDWKMEIDSMYRIGRKCEIESLSELRCNFSFLTVVFLPQKIRQFVQM